MDSYNFDLVQISDTNFELKINGHLYTDIMEYELSGQLQSDKIEKKKHENLHKAKNIDINYNYKKEDQDKRNIKHIENIQNKGKDLIDN